MRSRASRFLQCFRKIPLLSPTIILHKFLQLVFLYDAEAKEEAAETEGHPKRHPQQTEGKADSQFLKLFLCLS